MRVFMFTMDICVVRLWQMFIYTHRYTNTFSKWYIQLGYDSILRRRRMCCYYVWCIKDKKWKGLIHFSLVIFIIIVNAAVFKYLYIHWNQQSNKNGNKWISSQSTKCALVINSNIKTIAAYHEWTSEQAYERAFNIWLNVCVCLCDCVR